VGGAHLKIGCAKVCVGWKADALMPPDEPNHVHRNYSRAPTHHNPEPEGTLCTRNRRKERCQRAGRDAYGECASHQGE
jgi:hypothetical protein